MLGILCPMCKSQNDHPYDGSILSFNISCSGCQRLINGYAGRVRSSRRKTHMDEFLPFYFYSIRMISEDKTTEFLLDTTSEVEIEMKPKDLIIYSSVRLKDYNELRKTGRRVNEDMVRLFPKHPVGICHFQNININKNYDM
jgi:hypothetical protein